MKKCSICKLDNMKEIEITTRGAFKVIEIPKGITINPKSSKIKKYLCLECGYIDLYIDDFEKFK